MELPDIIKKPLDDIYQVVGPRFKNPFLGAFMISWVVINWKPLLFVVFASYPIEVKISYVGSKYNDFSNIILWPLAYAVFHAILFPYLSLWMERKLLSKYTKGKAEMEVGIQLIGEDNAFKLAEKKLETAKKLAEVQAQESINKTIKELTEKLNQYQEDLKSASEEKVKLAEQHLSAITLRDTEYSERLEDLNKQLSQRNERVTQFENVRVPQLEIERNTLKQTLTEQDHTIKSLELKVSGSNHVKDLDNKEISRQKAEIDKLKQEIIVTQKRSTSENKEIKELLGKTKSDYDNEIKELKFANYELNKKTELLKHELDAATKEKTYKLIFFHPNSRQTKVIEKKVGSTISYVKEGSNRLYTEDEIQDLMASMPHRRFEIEENS